MEIWKSIEGYEGLYEVSNLGRVRRGDRVLKPHKRKRDGYLAVSLCKNNVAANKKVHQLVARTFIQNPTNLRDVNHVDENKENNAVSNLEWCDHRTNCNHGSRNQRISVGNSRPVEQLYAGVVVQVWPSACAAGRAGYTKCSVIQCCNENAKSHKGYQWRWKK